MTQLAVREPAPMDFRRNVYCVLGLAFDAMDIDAVMTHLHDAAESRTRCVFTTPNVNFIASAMRNERFRDDVLKSDLCVPDGMPIVWLSRMQRIPLRDRVSGSDLFERLAQSSPHEPMRIFFFGGQCGVADIALERVNDEAGGLYCVGAVEPGFGSVEVLSDPAFIERINAQRSDFLVLSLGAEKAQAWIERNLSLLQPPVVSHLGAVLKFAAGAVRRAPQFVRRMGLEWLWRMKEEPHLWRRYFDDAVVLLNILVCRQIPQVLRGVVSRPSRETPWVGIEERADARILRLRGAWRVDDLLPLREALEQVAASRQRVGLDLSRVSYMDSAAIGLLLLLRGHCLRFGLTMQVIGVSKPLTRIFRFHCVDYLIDAMESIAPVTRINLNHFADSKIAAGVAIDEAMAAATKTVIDGDGLGSADRTSSTQAPEAPTSVSDGASGTDATARPQWPAERLSSR